MWTTPASEWVRRPWVRFTGSSRCNASAGIRHLPLNLLQSERRDIAAIGFHISRLWRRMMQVLSTRFRYGVVAQAFHWLTAILVIAAYFLGPGGSERRAFSAAMETTRQIHEALGVSLFAIVLLRVVWRAFDEDTEHGDMATWMRCSSKFV